MYISRISEDKREQLTSDHLLQSAKIASDWAKPLNCAQMAYLATVLHDMGKHTQLFLSYLYKQDKNERGRVVHSTQGAKYVYETAMQHTLPTLAAEIIGICIAGHHGVLMDGITPEGDTPFLNRISGPDTAKLHYSEAKEEFIKSNILPEGIDFLFEKAQNELKNFIAECRVQKMNAAFMLHLLVKFLFSCLVDADRYNAYCFEINVQAEYREGDLPWDGLISCLENYLDRKNMNPDTPISKIRKKVSENCRTAAGRPPGIYKLEVPTGGGKTLSSLRFALNHAKLHGMQRIVFVIPYLSILEQTAKSIREALGLSEDDPCVLEHHSNLIPPEDGEEAKNIKLLTDRWGAPIVITTAVQFLESVYSEKASKLRKFHNMTKSVIIFDEVQSLPIKCVYLFNEALNFLSVFGKSTILLCTATQPLLDCVERRICLSPQPNLVNNMEKDFSILKRTRIIADTCIKEKYTTETLADFVLEKQRINNNCLVILNTKKNVQDLFITLKERIRDHGKKIRLFHLSTLMCPAHRLDTINEVKTCIENQDPAICVSSQLIEAGVDLSFGCVVRACAGLDSIAQAAGRCNRNGEDQKGRDVYIVRLAQEDLSKLPDIKAGADVTQRIIDEGMTDLLSKQALERYYSEYFYKRTGQMDYQLGNLGDLYDLVSDNQKGRYAYENRFHHGMNQPQFIQALQTAGEKFFVIEKNTISVLVPYKEGCTLLEKYRHAKFAEKPAILHKMGRYCVQLYRYQAEGLDGAGALLHLDDNMFILDSDFYDLERGVDFKKEMKLLYIN